MGRAERAARLLPSKVKKETKNKMSSANVNQILSDCRLWAEQAAKVGLEHFRQPTSVDYKADESPVTVVDRLIEKNLKEAISKAYPNDSLFGEESGIDGDTSGNLWVIDPIDGTRSFISGNPLFGMLLAYVQNGRTVAGTISMPVLGEVYTGGKGVPATKNGSPAKVSSQTNIDDCVLYINEGEKLLAEEPAVLNRLASVGRIRRFGYDCYPHALLASGHVDAVVDYGLKPYDFLALSAVIEAAGGVISDWDGNLLGLESDGRVIAAATPELHREFLAILKAVS